MREPKEPKKQIKTIINLTDINIDNYTQYSIYEFLSSKVLEEYLEQNPIEYFQQNPEKLKNFYIDIDFDANNNNYIYNNTSSYFIDVKENKNYDQELIEYNKKLKEYNAKSKINQDKRLKTRKERKEKQILAKLEKLKSEAKANGIEI